MIELAADIDVRDELARISARRRWSAIRNRTATRRCMRARQVAEAIEGARFVELDSANHILLGDEPAWQVFVREVRAFLKAT